MRRLLPASLVFLCAFMALAAHATAAPLRILVIGNSYVSRPNLCARLERLAKAMDREAKCDLVEGNDYSLEDHWDEGKAQRRIREGWDVVVLQQGPSAEERNRATFLRDAKRFDAVIRAAGASPAVFSAWPAQIDVGDFPAAIRSARAAADAINAPLIPVAEAWMRLLQKDYKLRLWSDGVHATDLGADLELLATWFTLFPAGPQDFTEAYVTRIAKEMHLPARTRDALFDAATRAVDEPLPLK